MQYRCIVRKSEEIHTSQAFLIGFPYSLHCVFYRYTGITVSLLLKLWLRLSKNRSRGIICPQIRSLMEVHVLVYVG